MQQSIMPVKDPKKYLQSVDPILAAVIAQIQLPYRKPSRRSRFEGLVEAIVSQQLSVKAADTIFERFTQLFPGKNFPTPEEVANTSIAKLRSVGLSGSKATYILDLAQKVSSKELKLQSLHRLEDEAVIEELVKIKGIGRWTAEMFLMSSLNRPDLFSHGDLGLRNAIAKWYGFKKPLTQKQIEKIVQKWSPHRTLASRYLWKSLDLKK
ncbi:MAG: DNA-3-methyladenine glycosylase [bacterium]|nr:DNA-3-methyladenine glycosylase [bacterium]